MNNYNEQYSKWYKYSDTSTKDELSKMTDEQIYDSFYKELEFGTGGLRGVIGPGTNRINKYVVSRTTKGLCEYIKRKSNNIKNESVVIAYDSRCFSKEFAEISANILQNHNIKAYIFDELRPTPELSFAVRYLKATAGIVITASHNPAKYNGYKIYWSDGGQIPLNVATDIFDEIKKLDYFETDFSKSKTEPVIIGDEIDRAYLDEILKLTVSPNIKYSDFKLVYTPLHGSGNKLVRSVLKKSGFTNIITVKEQEMPDGEFPTVRSPNPEDKDCFNIAVKYADENDADLIIATDPDSDRMGIAVKDETGKFVTLTGNQVGIMLMDYILSNKKNIKNGAIVTTIVSTKMADTVARYYGVKLFRTLTGFKFIGEKIHEFEINNSYEYLFGFEESYGYLAGTYARDKDAVLASMLTAQMAAFYSKKGKTLYDVMEELYKKFGGFSEKLKSITLEGSNGLKKIQLIMKSLRENPPENIGNSKVKAIIDYLGETSLPKSDVLCFCLDNDSDIYIRPSGTEPKIKIYTLASAKNYNDALLISEKSEKEIITYIRNITK